jgi:hypothetical protein
VLEDELPRHNHVVVSDSSSSFVVPLPVVFSSVVLASAVSELSLTIAFRSESSLMNVVLQNVVLQNVVFQNVVFQNVVFDDFGLVVSIVVD